LWLAVAPPTPKPAERSPGKKGPFVWGMGFGLPLRGAATRGVGEFCARQEKLGTAGPYAENLF